MMVMMREVYSNMIDHRAFFVTSGDVFEIKGIVLYRP